MAKRKIIRPSIAGHNNPAKRFEVRKLLTNKSITEADLVVCPICGEKYLYSAFFTHIYAHELTLPMFREKYPETMLEIQKRRQPDGIEGVDFVTCPICGIRFKQILTQHLRLHGLTRKEFELQFPNVQTICIEVQVRYSETKTGTNHPNYGKRGAECGWYGTKQSEEMCRRKSEARMGHKVSNETKEKIRQKAIGRHPSEEIRALFSRQRAGPNNHNWKGGISKLPYAPNWTENLRCYIRERDGYICQICGKKNSRCVHHINFNKQDCRESNLITLCRSCNNSVNFNREFWTGALSVELVLNSVR